MSIFQCLWNFSSFFDYSCSTTSYGQFIIKPRLFEIILEAPLVSRFQIKFHEIKNINRYNGVNWRCELLRKIAFWTRNEENFGNFDEDFETLDYSLVQRYILSIYLISDGWDIPASPSPQELKYLTLNYTRHFCENFFLKRIKINEWDLLIIAFSLLVILEINFLKWINGEKPKRKF